MTTQLSPLVEDLRARVGDMLEMLHVFVETESPSKDIEAVTACADVISAHGQALLGSAPEVFEREGRPHLSWRWPGEPRVLLLAHLDTVWPIGTTARWPFAVSNGKATGPGTSDMKAGLVQGLFALASLDSLEGIELLVTSDEELGSRTSRKLIEDAARNASAALVLEPSWRGALKVARKGCYTYVITLRGRAVHASLGPGAGANALISLAHQIVAIAEIGRGQTTVTPTLASAGTTSNTIPADAKLYVDVRVPTQEELDRVDASLRSLDPVVAGVKLDVQRTAGRPPMPRSASEELFARAQRVAPIVAITELDGMEVGGGSDGNFTAAVGTPTLDGLGAVGEGAHAEGEHVIVDKMPERAALLAALIADLRAN